MAKKRVLLIIAPLDFSDLVATTLKNLLEESSIQVDIASTMTGTARGVNGTTIPISLDLKDANPREFLGAILVGGPGFISYFSGYRLLRGKLVEMYDSHKLLAGVGEAVLLLSRIGLLKGRQVANPADSEILSTLQREGSIIQNTQITLDENILTASTDVAPRELASRVLERLLAAG